MRPVVIKYIVWRKRRHAHYSRPDVHFSIIIAATEPFRRLPIESYLFVMKIDIHVHCSELSNCGRNTAVEMVEAAIEAELDGLVFTNHHKYMPPEMIAELNNRYAPFRVFNGIESTIEGEDMLIIGSMRDAYKTGKDCSYTRTLSQVRADGGCMVIAHPFRLHEEFRMDIHADPPDALEYASTNIYAENYDRIIRLAEELGIPATAASDAHRAEDVGCRYLELEADVNDEKTLAGLIRRGGFACVTERNIQRIGAK